MQDHFDLPELEGQLKSELDSLLEQEELKWR